MWHWLRSWFVTPSNKQRPPLDFMGPYNIPRSDLPDTDEEFWTETGKIKSLSLREFFKVRTDIVAALSKHGRVYGESEGEHDFFVYDDKFFDRTQKIEVETSDRLAKIIAPAVAELQRVLKKHSLWRVMFIGHGHDSQAQEQFFVVYPDVVRIRQGGTEKSVDQALVENAQLRIRHQREREEHLIRRKADLKKAIVAAIANSERQVDDLTLVAWYTTVSALDWDWGWEGMPGTSVWVLVGRDVLGEPEAMQMEIDTSTRWVMPDGRFNDDTEPKGARRLLHFEDRNQVRQELTIAIAGRQLHLKCSDTRPTV